MGSEVKLRLRHKRIQMIATSKTEGTIIVSSVSLERAKGIEPSYPAWKAGVLPLNYARVPGYVTIPGG